MSLDYLTQIHWNEAGLIPAIAQDYQTGEVLMVAWMNQEALTLTIKEERAIYWSRSRNKLWRKGEESGHIQKIHHIYLDCDADVLLLKIEQISNIACHTGRTSCFYRELIDQQWVVIMPPLKDPNIIYQKD